MARGPDVSAGRARRKGEAVCGTWTSALAELYWPYAFCNSFSNPSKYSCACLRASLSSAVAFLRLSLCVWVEEELERAEVVSDEPEESEVLEEELDDSVEEADGGSELIDLEASCPNRSTSHALKKGRG